MSSDPIMGPGPPQIPGRTADRSDAARRQWVQRPRTKGPRAPSAPQMDPWGRRARGPRAPSAPFGQGTKGPLGPWGVIPRSFRVDSNYEWVVIECKNEAFPTGSLR